MIDNKLLSIKTKSLVWLDLLRGIAALVVVIGHVRALTLHDYDPNKVGIIGKIFYFSTGLGHQAVIVFFVLSGFLISRSIENRIQRKSWNPISYFFDRAVRLLTVLVPALFVTLIFDCLGTNIFTNAMAYNGSISTLPGLAPLENLNFVTFIGNIFFLQGIFVTTFGSNTPLWSLSNEFWYYILYPILFFTFFKIQKAFNYAILVSTSLIILYLIGKEAQLYFIIWLMGVGAFFLCNQQIPSLKQPIIFVLSPLEHVWEFSLVQSHNLEILIWQLAQSIQASEFSTVRS